MPKTIKLILILVAIAAFVGIMPFGDFAFGQGKPLEIKYPDLPNILTPRTTSYFLPDYIRYVMYFILTISGIAALGVLIIAGFRYTTSVGNPGIQSDAKNQIFSAFLGIAILFGSFLILNTINPRLTTLTGDITSKRNITLYAEENWQPEDTAQKYTTSISDFQGFQPKSLKFVYTDPNEVTVYLYEKPGYDGVKTKVTGDIMSMSPPGSMEIIWHIPGVYLYTQENWEGDYELVTLSTSYVGDKWNGKVKSIRVSPLPSPYVVALFEDADFKGRCDVSNIGEWPNIASISFGQGLSSLMIFRSKGGSGEGVTFFENPEFQPQPGLGPFTGPSEWPDLPGMGWDDQITSIDINGNFMTAVWSDPNFGGKCQVFTRSDGNLRDDALGQCGFALGGMGFQDCISSFKIFPIEAMPSAPGGIIGAPPIIPPAPAGATCWDDPSCAMTSPCSGPYLDASGKTVWCNI